LILDFIERADGNGPSFDPYPISLRGVNWIKFLSLYGIGDGRNEVFDGGRTIETETFEKYPHFVIPA